MDLTRNEPLDLVALALCLTKAKGDYALAAAQARSSRVSSRVKDILEQGGRHCRRYRSGLMGFYAR